MGTKPRTLVKPGAKPITAYYEALAGFTAQDIAHEQAVRSAFQTLLAEAARPHKWTLIPELGAKFRGKRIIPDGTLRDTYHLPRGYWEAKDLGDNLNAEIAAKIAKGYPTTNTIFWTPDRAVLFQDSQPKLDLPIREPAALCDLLNSFFAFTAKPILDFDEAVADFTDKVPALGARLAEIIAEAHKSNKKFKTAFDAFFALCKTALNPNIAQAAVDEMLIQHLLTERLFKTVFSNPEFLQKNIIAAEVENVIAALASRSFTREDFLKQLDRFYLAIEAAAAAISDFSDKQHFLNTVYERFFQGYCVKTADTHGIVYTPQPIVDFMCASVEHVLKEEFGKSLGDDGVVLLDPCTGTGNFVVNLMRRAAARQGGGKRHLQRMYREQLFANEVMLLPYYIAALNIEHEFWEHTGEYEPFEGLCFVDTLDLAEARQMGMFSERNLERVDRQKKAPITVVIGNPPYNMGQLDENDNNKNRRYNVVDARVKATYSTASTSTLKTKLYDPYVKFFRWASDRLGSREGIVCFVSNNSFVANVAFDGMRRHLLRDFQAVYHLDLEGNTRHDPTLSGTQYNVFGIQVGVGITIAVRHRASNRSGLHYASVDKELRRFEKLAWLQARDSLSHVDWRTLRPDNEATWIPAEHRQEFDQGIPIAPEAHDSAVAPKTVFARYLLGINTARDEVVYDFGKGSLLTKASEACDQIAAEVDRLKRKAPKRIDDTSFDYTTIKWSSTLKTHVQRKRLPTFDRNNAVTTLYRPFTRRWLYYDRVLLDRPSRFDRLFATHGRETNRLVGFTLFGSERPFMAIAADQPCDLHVVGAGSGLACTPLYTRDADHGDARENITNWALKSFRDHYADKKLTKWDIFHYVYAILHHPGYRGRFADNLKRELPRIPFAPDFRAFAKAGERLADLHLRYDNEKYVKPYPLKERWAGPKRRDYRVTKMKLNKEKTRLIYNEELILEGIPPESLLYRLGNRSALEWVIDQYQVYTDPRSKVTSDPNAWCDEHDDEQYILRLLKQVITVSLETLKLVRALPAEFSDGKAVEALDTSAPEAPEAAPPAKDRKSDFKLRSDPPRQRKLGE